MSKQMGDTGKIGIGKFWAWNSRAISLACNFLVVGYISIYCTDTLEMTPALVGVLLMVSKLIDGVTDLFAGYIVDKTNTKLGKGRPYELAIIGVWLCTWLMYSCPPQFNTTVKAVWVLCMYALVNSIFTTLLNANQTAYMVRAFNSEKQYVTLASFGGMTTIVGAIVVNISFPMLMGRLATSAQGWRTLIAIYAIPLALIGILRFVFVKEVYDVDAMSGNTSDKIRFSDVIHVLKNNKYIYIVAIMLFISNLIGNMGVAVYYYKYIVGNVELMSVTAMMTIVVLPTMALIPFLKNRKISTSAIIIGGCLIGAAGYVIMYFAQANMVLLIIGSLVTGVGALPISYLSGLMIVDCANYNEWKKQPRMEGTLGCVTGFATKVGSAAGAGILGVLLTWAGYDATLDAMPESAFFMIRLLFSVIPLVFYLLVAFSLKFYKLDRMMPQINKDIEEARAARIQ